MDLIFKCVNAVDLLVILSLCGQLLLDEAYGRGLAANFGAKKMESLLGAQVWCPRLRKDCHRVCKEC